jgi:NADPH:quinone reductase-like Zn-dependent oxidoreductase
MVLAVGEGVSSFKAGDNVAFLGQAFAQMSTVSADACVKVCVIVSVYSHRYT